MEDAKSEERFHMEICTVKVAVCTLKNQQHKLLECSHAIILTIMSHSLQHTMFTVEMKMFGVFCLNGFRTVD